MSAKRRAQNSRGRDISTATVIGINDYIQPRSKSINLLPKTLKQEEYICYLTDETKKIIFATGPAGTGKTLLAVLAAIKSLREGAVTRVIITRPAVGVDDEQHGFLPGDLNSKMEPWVRPIIDVFNDYYQSRDVVRMLDEKILEISPLAYMRGRNFKNSFIVFDEAQNATVNQMKMVLTRLAENSRMVITGDLNQTDRKFSTDNGLKDILARLNHSKSIASVSFARKDVQRHPTVSEILKLYGED